MADNDWSVGTMYIKPNGPNGYFRQPGGSGTQVFPAQVTGQVSYFEVTPFSELTGSFIMGCQHSMDYITVYRDIDMEDGISVALIACSVCSYVQRVIKPFEDAVLGSGNGNLINQVLYP